MVWRSVLSLSVTPHTCGPSSCRRYRRSRSRDRASLPFSSVVRLLALGVCLEPKGRKSSQEVPCCVAALGLHMPEGGPSPRVAATRAHMVASDPSSSRWTREWPLAGSNDVIDQGAALALAQRCIATQMPSPELLLELGRALDPERLNLHRCTAWSRGPLRGLSQSIRPVALGRAEGAVWRAAASHESESVIRNPRIRLQNATRAAATRGRGYFCTSSRRYSYGRSWSRASRDQNKTTVVSPYRMRTCQQTRGEPERATASAIGLYLFNHTSHRPRW